MVPMLEGVYDLLWAGAPSIIRFIDPATAPKHCIIKLSPLDIIQIFAICLMTRSLLPIPLDLQAWKYAVEILRR